jgi:hypothetical protein
VYPTWHWGKDTQRVLLFLPGLESSGLRECAVPVPLVTQSDLNFRHQVCPGFPGY